MSGDVSVSQKKRPLTRPEYNGMNGYVSLRQTRKLNETSVPTEPAQETEYLADWLDPDYTPQTDLWG